MGGKKKKRGELPDLPEPGSPTSGLLLSDHGHDQNAVIQCAPQKKQTAKAHSKADPGASPSAPPLNKAPRMGSPEALFHSIFGNDAGVFGEDACFDEDCED